MDLSQLIDGQKASLDNNNIWVSKSLKELSSSNEIWNRIYNFDTTELKRLHNEFSVDKLNDLLVFVNQALPQKKGMYLEIGCGPSFLAKYLLQNSSMSFVGVDFNYEALLTLQHYFDECSIDRRRYLLIYCDIRDMPVKDKTIDFIYGGGVIEHVPDTDLTLHELYRVMKKGGISLNSVPALNFFWFTRFYMSIPNVPIIRSIFEFIHIKLLNEKVLNHYYGYELSFTKNKLVKLHSNEGFKNVKVGAFSFHPSRDKLTNKFLFNLFYKITTSVITCPFYFVKATK